MFNNLYQGLTVLVTGHTGFKGSWLALWLLKLGAKVVGYSLKPPTQPNHYDLLSLDCESIFADIRNIEKVSSAIHSFKPDIVFHLAAQSLVLRSYKDPIETLETNVMGTGNVFEACRKIDSVRAVVNITSDKCYENHEWARGYKEDDPMGGHDLYSASKGCAELITSSYRRSFFPVEEYPNSHEVLVASVRAGNVVGGGDWGEDRLVPDIMRAASKREAVFIRHPEALRPWQHVMDPLAGYLLLGQRLLERKKEFSEAWNFGPDDQDHKNVLTVVKELQSYWSTIEFELATDEKSPHEATVLKLDCSKAHATLGWRPVWNGPTMFEKTVQWYREFYESGRVLSEVQMAEYTKNAKKEEMSWAVQ